MLLPTQTCRDCCHVGYDHKQMIMVHDNDYVESIRSSTRWWDGVFIGSFAQMASHYAHVTMNERRTSLDDTPLPQVMHVTYPKEAITESQLMRFLSNVTRLVAVMHESEHYTVLEIDIPSKRIMIFDGFDMSPEVHCNLCNHCYTLGMSDPRPDIRCVQYLPKST